MKPYCDLLVIATIQPAIRTALDMHAGYTGFDNKMRKMV